MSSQTDASANAAATFDAGRQELRKIERGQLHELNAFPMLPLARPATVTVIILSLIGWTWLAPTVGRFLPRTPSRSCTAIQGVSRAW
mgnify:CR=1 FL=1